MEYNYISFNPLRSVGIPSVKSIKPEKMFENIALMKQAQIILFPEYWQVNSLVYALKKRIFPSAATYHLGHDKIEMTRSLMAVRPHMLPQTLFVSAKSVRYDDVVKQFGVPFVCKEIRSSCGMGVFLIKSERDFNCYIKNNDIAYIQEYLKMDRDLRVVIIGEKAVAAYWRVKPKGAFHNNVSKGGRIDRENIPWDIVSSVIPIAKQLGVDHAGFDVAVTDKGIFILEFNLFFGTKGIPFNLVSLGHLISDYLQTSKLEPYPLPNCYTQLPLEISTQYNVPSYNL